MLPLPFLGVDYSTPPLEHFVDSYEPNRSKFRAPSTWSAACSERREVCRTHQSQEASAYEPPPRHPGVQCDMSNHGEMPRQAYNSPQNPRRTVGQKSIPHVLLKGNRLSAVKFLNYQNTKNTCRGDTNAAPSFQTHHSGCQAFIVRRAVCQPGFREVREMACSVVWLARFRWTYRPGPRHSRARHGRIPGHIRMLPFQFSEVPHGPRSLNPRLGRRVCLLS